MKRLQYSKGTNRSLSKTVKVGTKVGHLPGTPVPEDASPTPAFGEFGRLIEEGQGKIYLLEALGANCTGSEDKNFATVRES